MLISKVSEEGDGEKWEGEVTGIFDHEGEISDPIPEYRTANDLFELVAQNSHFDSIGNESLTHRDLILLYKKIDLRKKLMNDANDMKINEIAEKKPNQHVETIVYNGDQDSDSDLSDICAEDISNLVMINQERLDFFNDKSLENLLCPKFGGVEINSSMLSTEYDKNFLFKDPYIDRQLKNLNVFGSCSQIGNMFSSSLIDYICCKRLEDNYNFYMDNIIKYVQHTIDQLKRISNGDYLTEKAKEKWKELDSDSENVENDKKVLATSTSIPLHLECKKEGSASWGNAVHSEVDVRSLSKILEKKIVVEIPKLICGSFKLFSKGCAENLIISCQREHEKDKESRVDVVLHLEKSETGQVISNISSVMILQKTPALTDIHSGNLLPLPYKEEGPVENVNEKEVSASLVTEVLEQVAENDIDEQTTDSAKETPKKTKTPRLEQTETPVIEQNDQSLSDLSNDSLETYDYPFSEYEKENEKQVSFDVKQYSTSSCLALKEIAEKPAFLIPDEETYHLISPGELRLTIKRLNVPPSLLEESSEEVAHRKKSPMRVRVKSPYENKSFLLEEKKRKRLLEIRERREKKKLALSDCKISKHRYGKGTIMPKATSSVTKLSISNKSFYNSIYGQSGANAENKTVKTRYRKEEKHYTPGESSSDVKLNEHSVLHESSVMLSPEKSKKYVNRSYYLDEAETEVMFTQLKQNEIDDTNPISPPNCSLLAKSNDLGNDNHFINDFTEPADSSLKNEHRRVEVKQNNRAVETPNKFDKLVDNNSTVGMHCSVPETTTKIMATSNVNESKKVAGVECKKSIDKLYELMKKFTKPNSKNVRTSNSKMTTNYETINPGSNIPVTESRTSLKHHIPSSNISKFSIVHEKTNLPIKTNQPVKHVKKSDPLAVVPKVIISSKLQTSKIDIEKTKRERRKTLNSPKKQIDNPLKAISEIQHILDNVQKSRQNNNEQKQWKRNDIGPGDGKSLTRQNYFRRRSRFDDHNAVTEHEQEKKLPGALSPRDRRSKPLSPTELARMPHQQIVLERKVSKKKIADIIDEEKEARGEAVRGPSKAYSRLNSLAQPKRSYVQARAEGYQSRFGRVDRLRAPPAALPPADRAPSANTRHKSRKTGDNVASAPSVKRSPSPQLDRCVIQPGGIPGKSHHPTSNINKVGLKASDPPIKCNEVMKKMVAVESYVKSHYGRQRAGSPRNVVLAGNKSRVPLIPNDFELASMASSPTAEEANELGNRLHRMINSMLINSSAAPVNMLPEVAHVSKNSKSTGFLVDRLPREPRSESDYRISILEDKDIKTAVENIGDGKNNHSINSANRSLSELNKVKSANTRIEMDKLENALYNQISGAFQKRLRIQNLTLTPKHSMQQVLLVQSGDAGSLLVKSTVSSIMSKKGSRQSLVDIEVLPKLSNSHFDWNFTQIPMQIATVGYAFAEYQKPGDSSSLRVQELKISNSTEDCETNNTSKSDKMNQCFKGVNLSQLMDNATQVNAIPSAGAIDYKPDSVTCVHFENEPFAIFGDTDSNITNSNNEYDNEKKNTVNTTDYSTEKSSNSEENENPNRNGGINNAVLTNAIKPENSKEEAENLVHGANVERVATQKDSKNLDVNPNLTQSKSAHSGRNIPEEVGYTTSLDMLVGLLNEIQKITCQSQMATTNSRQDCVNLNNEAAAANEEYSYKNIPDDHTSISSLDELRQLESETSVYSLYNISIDGMEATIAPRTDATDNVKSNNEDDGYFKKDVKENVLKITIDKEVSANLLEEKCYHSISTNVSSNLLPVSGTAATNSIDILSESSAQTVMKDMDHQKVFSNNLFISEPIQKGIELPKVALNSQTALVPQDKTFCGHNFLPLVCNHEIKNGKILVCKDMKKSYVNPLDLDPMFKIKRDILVTMYSILVFTVFAALSVPQLMLLE